MVTTTGRDFMVIEKVNPTKFDLHIFLDKDQMVEWLQLPQNRGKQLQPTNAASRRGMRHTYDHRWEVI